MRTYRQATARYLNAIDLGGVRKIEEASAKEKCLLPGQIFGDQPFSQRM